MKQVEQALKDGKVVTMIGMMKKHKAAWSQVIQTTDIEFAREFAKGIDGPVNYVFTEEMGVGTVK